MSCGNPVEGEEALMQKRKAFDKSTWCIKCKTHRGNIVIRHAVFCKNCFFPFVTTKFRRCIEPHINESSQTSKRKALRASGNLLVGFSGGLGSTVLLDVLSSAYFAPENDRADGKGGRRHPRNKRVWTKAFACYVEVSSAFPEMRDRSSDIRTFFEKIEDFELVPARIEDAFDPGWWNSVGGRNPDHTFLATLTNEDLPLFHEKSPSGVVSGSPVELLRAYLASLPTHTAVQSVISTLTRLILVHTARHLQCSHVVLGTSLTSLSISLIALIAQGGGFNLRDEYFEELHDISNTEDGDKEAETMPVRIVKPLHDVGMKECAAWAYWRQLSVVRREGIPDFSVKQTIGSLTKSFIIGLERDYPSTVSAVVRTCNKVAPKDEARDRCILCQRATPSSAQDWKAGISVRSRDEYSLTPPPTTSDEVEMPNCPRVIPGFLSPRLCYACHTHLTSKSPRSGASCNEPISLPQWTNALLSSALSSGSTGSETGEIWSTSKTSSERMKAAVDDFLL